MKIKYFSLKGGGGVQSEPPKPSLNQPLIPVWFTDFLTTWAKPEVNMLHNAYDLFIMRALMGF